MTSANLVDSGKGLTANHHRRRHVADKEISLLRPEDMPLMPMTPAQRSGCEQRRKNDFERRVQQNRVVNGKPSVNRLPCELLCEVFKLCSTELAPIPVSEDGGAFSISRVCSLWRRVALDTPQLWSSISLTLTDDNLDRLCAARAWFARARKYPRRLAIHPGDGQKYDVWGANVISYLINDYQPFQMLDLKLHDEQLKQLEGTLQKSLPTLQVLRLTCMDGFNTGYANPPRLPALFAHGSKLPNLKELALVGNWDSRIFTIIQSSTNNVVSLTLLNGNRLSQCSDILKQCPEIETCILNIMDSDLDASSVVPDIVLQRLKILDIHAPGFAAQTFAAALTAPVLSSLKISSMSYPAVLDVSTFRQMIERSDGMPRLTHLHLEWLFPGLDPSVVLEILPCLEHAQFGETVLKGPRNQEA